MTENQRLKCMLTKLFVLSAGLLFALLPAKASAQAGQKDFDQQSRTAVEKGLDYLAKVQNSDGSWNCKIGYKLNESYFGEDGKHVGVTALASMAFMMAGSFSDRGPYSKVVSKGIDFILSNVRKEDGYITANGSRMYSHAFATLFLAHAYGMTKRDDIKDKLKQAVNLIVQTQNKEGGWRYQPQPNDADLSVTVSTLQALRAARNVGISVPIDVIERATKYVSNCAIHNGFRYQSTSYYPDNDPRNSYALTACGVVSLHSAGVYQSDAVKNGINRLRNIRELQWRKYHYFYGHFYACQAMYLSGGEHWKDYFPKVKKEIIQHQGFDGSWEDDVGKAYATAMACIILQIPTEQFPTFQK